MNAPKISSQEIERGVETRLDDYEMADLLSSVGNHANKLVLLASMKPQVIYGMTGDASAFNLLADSQRDSLIDGWVPNYSAAFKYFVNSLAPIGMVAKEYINELEGTVGYEITDKGINVGVTLAGLLLDFADRHDLALSQVFGDTTSKNPEARAGGVRWSIYQGLATQAAEEITSATRLATSVEETPKRVITNLDELSRIGLVHYEPGTKRPPQTYSIELEELRKHLPRMRGRSFEIAQFIVNSNVTSTDIASLAEAFTLDNPENNTPAFRASIKGVLKNLELIEISKREVVASGDAQVWVDDSQQAILQELVQIIDALQSGEAAVFKKGNELAAKIIADPNKVARLLAHEKDVSVHFHGQFNAQKRGARILEILSHSGGDLTYEQIRQELESLGDIVSKQGIARVLKGRTDVHVRTEKSKGSESRVTLKTGEVKE